MDILNNGDMLNNIGVYGDMLNNIGGLWGYVE